MIVTPNIFNNGVVFTAPVARQPSFDDNQFKSAIFILIPLYTHSYTFNTIDCLKK